MELYLDIKYILAIIIGIIINIIVSHLKSKYVNVELKKTMSTTSSTSCNIRRCTPPENPKIDIEEPLKVANLSEWYKNIPEMLYTTNIKDSNYITEKTDSDLKELFNKLST
jgi:hypothetical protein